jgi:hypothetical protein
MRVANYDRVEPPVPCSLPFQLVQTCCRRAAAAMLVVAVPAVVAVAIISLALILEAMVSPGIRAVMAQHPALGPEILVGLAFWVYLLALPLRRLVHRLAGSRIIEVGEATVSVTESGILRTHRWSTPLKSYIGVAHHVRASLSGTRHELILVHPTRAKSLLLGLSARISQSEVDRVAALLGHKEIPPSELYRFKARIPRLSLPMWRRAVHA